jgi:hypothetical protein
MWTSMGPVKLRIAFACLLVVLAACGKEAPPTSRQGAGAAGFEVKTFEGDPYALSDHRGEPVVLNFWESW